MNMKISDTTIDNNEYMYVMLDKDSRVLFGVKKDGTVSWKKATPKHVIEACNTTIDSNEFVYVMRDNDGKLLAAIKNTGELVFYAPVTFLGGIMATSTNSLRKDILQYDKLKGKKVSIIGDSISTFQGYSGGYYPAGDVTDVNDTWWMQVINYFEMELLKNVSFSSSTVTGDSTVAVASGRNTPGCCDYRISALSEDGVTPDIVLIYIGVNDRNRETTTVSTIEPNDAIVGEGIIYDFAKAYDLMLYKIRKNYPNAMVYVASMPYRDYSERPFPYCNNQGVSYRQLSHAIMQAAEHIGAHYVNFYGRAWNGQSGFHGPHLLKAGMTMLARTFIKKIEQTY